MAGLSAPILPRIIDGTDPITGNLLIGPIDTHSPGHSPGQQTISGDYILQGKLRIELAGTVPGLEYDQLLIGGDAYLYGNIEVALLYGFIPDLSDVFDVLVAKSFTFGPNFSIVFPTLPGGKFFTYSVVDLGNGQSAFRIVDPIAGPRNVPEPSTLAVLGFGLAGLYAVRRRNRRRR